MNSFTRDNFVYLIAEIGGNHEGSFDKAVELCSLAINSGVNCVKFQLYSADGLVNPVLSPDRHAHFKRFELTASQYIHLAQMCRKCGVDFSASVWQLDLLSYIDQYLSFYKIGSGDLTAVPLVREFALRGKPIILSTGLSDFKEVQRTVGLIRDTNSAYLEPGMITLMQCTSMYPIPPEDANLAVIGTLGSIPNVTLGYSDHTSGLDALVYSVAAGARVLEFHFTDRRDNQTFRDHSVSLMQDEVLDLRQRCLHVSRLLGTSQKEPLPIEIRNDHVNSFRRALYPSRDLVAGSVITASDLLCLRPRMGIPAEDFDLVIGRTLKSSIGYLNPLDYSLFED
jgi:N,N'-diacetyllegionaminate synthase